MSQLVGEIVIRKHKLLNFSLCKNAKLIKHFNDEITRDFSWRSSHLFQLWVSKGMQWISYCFWVCTLLTNQILRNQFPFFITILSTENIQFLRTIALAVHIRGMFTGRLREQFKAMSFANTRDRNYFIAVNRMRKNVSDKF